MDANFSLGYQSPNTDQLRGDPNPLTGMANFINQCVQSYGNPFSADAQNPGAQNAAPFYPGSQQSGGGRYPCSFNGTSMGGPAGYVSSPFAYGPTGSDSPSAYNLGAYRPGGLLGGRYSPSHAYQPSAFNPVPFGPGAFGGSVNGGYIAGTQGPAAYSMQLPYNHGAQNHMPHAHVFNAAPQCYRSPNPAAFYPPFAHNLGDDFTNPWKDNSSVNAFPANNHFFNAHNGINPGVYGPMRADARSAFPFNVQSSFAGGRQTGAAASGAAADSLNASGGKSGDKPTDKSQAENAKCGDSNAGGVTAEALAAAGKASIEPELDLLSKYGPGAYQSPIVYNPGLINPSAFGNFVLNPTVVNEAAVINPAAYNAGVFSGGRMADPTVLHAVPITFVPTWNPHAVYDRNMMAAPHAFAAIPQPSIFNPGAYNVGFVNPASDQSSCKA